ncbi:hypothetical protein G7067_12365 [Leucobacter insecticola]|uniref:Uncharacterized protein n=1 Tax=Leucobacter insecticola TaxID=2714934 RepID=A0A6G8FKL6_9MICO|nr:MaoC/PaaZ C-terminal domain-containing protein [Leucobacter insecticola]QIM17020.1 hypothetical protein G7067_12365 [Leucobacter insecticola]
MGEHLTRTTTIEAIVPKKNNMGAHCFVRLRHEVQTPRDLALVERQTLLYREPAILSPLATRKAPRPDGPAPEGWDWVRSTSADEVTLFRYSALTFDTSRIHYDLRYATREEGYPGLVVHGPLLATFLLSALLQELPGATITRFRFLARAPLFANETAHLCGRVAEQNPDVHSNTGGPRIELAAIAPNGAVAIAALAELG